MAEDSSDSKSPLLRIGKVTNCHGLRGELTVRPVNDDPDWLDDLERAVLIHPVLGRKELAILGIRPKGGDVLIQFESISDRTMAEKWRGAEVQAYQDELPEVEEDAFRVHDLIGLKVLDLTTKVERGVVLDVLSSSGSDFLEVQPAEAVECHPVVIPFNNVFFPELDLEKGFVYLDKLDDLQNLTSPISTKLKVQRPVKAKKNRKPAPSEPVVATPAKPEPKPKS